ncbi:YciI family protein [Cerasicoccus fimbriatus]|uniref:YciI family protein n=1 Tax=Cerasicoccus fimbriatus TaxID=3014554 RepID=UPI0022B4BEB1|nr:YciI family protein [Cerasicoccus sp. TK19100]
MPQFQVSIHRPKGFVASEVSAEMRRTIDAVNDEMVAAGVRVFVGGLRPLDQAKALRLQPDGEILESDGGYLSTDEFVDGFWVLDVSDMDAALTWGRKAAVACRGDVEVRPFY